MRKLLFAIIAVLIPSIVFSQEVDKKLHIDCLYPAVSINHPESHSTGSGVIVNSKKLNENLYLNTVLSCCHVFELDCGYNVVVAKYEDWSNIKEMMEFPSRILYKDKKYDLAVLTFLSDEKMPVANINLDYKPFIGHNLTKIGSGQGVQDILRIDEGKLNCTSIFIPDVMKDTPLYRTNIYTIPGDSGGPVYHDYKLVALINSLGTYSDGAMATNMSFAVPINLLQNLNKDTNNLLNFIYSNEAYIPKLQLMLMRLDLAKIERIEK